MLSVTVEQINDQLYTQQQLEESGSHFQWKANSVKSHIFVKTSTRWTDHACDTSVTAREQRSQTVVS